MAPDGGATGQVEVIEHGSRGRADPERLDDGLVRPAGQAVGQERRALGRLLDVPRESRE